MSKTVIFGFIAGFLAVLVFHQGAVFLLHHFGNAIPPLIELIGRSNGPGYATLPVPPFGVPQVISTAFWGGIWGIALAAILRRGRGPDLLTGFLFGAIVTTLVAFTLVAWLKGMPLMAGGDTRRWLRAAFLNGTWGWGTALLLRPLPFKG